MLSLAEFASNFSSSNDFFNQDVEMGDECSAQQNNTDRNEQDSEGKKNNNTNGKSNNKKRKRNDEKELAKMELNDEVDEDDQMLQ